MFRLHLFRIRAYTAAVTASFLAAIGRGGLQFMLIIWLQGIWLPQHGYDFTQTPLWAGIYMIPLTLGFFVLGTDRRHPGRPLRGQVDRHDRARSARASATCSSMLLPMNFEYLPFAAIILAFSVFAGLFITPNQTAVMNSLPPDQRGAGAGMNATFMNSAQVLSIGVFFSIVTLGLASTLPHHLYEGLVAQGVPSEAAHQVSQLPPIGSLFAAFLGFNPIQTEVPTRSSRASDRPMPPT